MKFKNLNPRQQQLLSHVSAERWILATLFIQQFKGRTAAITLKRDLAKMTKEGILERRGKGRATQYRLSPTNGLISPIDVDFYFQVPQEQRGARRDFNFELFDLLKKIEVFHPQELLELSQLHERFIKNYNRLSPGLLKREFERVTIELSWKSSAIEGNTYTLLETETLLKEGVWAKGKKAEEARMLLNHKDALDFIRTNTDLFKKINLSKIEQIHSLLTQDLGISKNLRKMRVGITGTDYRPIDNSFQIREAVESACQLINIKTDLFSKALLSILLLSYIQPFEDGNKRTSRLVANAVLLGASSFPLSFRSVNETEYKKAIVLFYEQNNLSAFKRIFLDQAKFAVENYFQP